MKILLKFLLYFNFKIGQASKIFCFQLLHKSLFLECHFLVVYFKYIMFENAVFLNFPKPLGFVSPLPLFFFWHGISYHPWGIQTFKYVNLPTSMLAPLSLSKDDELWQRQAEFSSSILQESCGKRTR